MNLTEKNNKTYNLEPAYIILTAGKNRDEYINDAIRTNRCNVLTATGSIYRDCPFINGYNSNYKFPKEIGELGSCVIISFLRGADIPVILGKLPTLESYDINDYENEYENNIIVENDNCIIYQKFDPENKQLNMGILGKRTGDNELNITVNSMNKNSKININVTGDLNFKSTNNVNFNIEKELNFKIKNENEKDKFGNIKYSLKEGFNLIDEFDNIIKTNDKGAEIQCSDNNTIKLKNNKTNLKEILDSLLLAIDNLTLKHPQGPTLPIPINKKEFDEVKQKIKDLME